MAWIESHQQLGRHPKTKAAARGLGITRVQLVGHLHYLWWWALDFAEDGDLSDIDPADIAEEAMWEGDPQVFITELTKAGFLTQDVHINDWEDYTGRLVSQRESNRERQRRYRERSKQADNEDEPVTSHDEGEPVTVTSRLRNGATEPNTTQPNQEDIDSPKSPKNVTKLEAPAPKGESLRDRFERWYMHYPRHVGKDAAWRWWQRRKPDAELTDVMIQAVEAAKRTDQWRKDKQFIPYPATWLNRGQWTDEHEDASTAGPPGVTLLPGEIAVETAPGEWELSRGDRKRYLSPHYYGVIWDPEKYPGSDGTKAFRAAVAEAKQRYEQEAA